MDTVLNKIDVSKCKNYKKDFVYNSCDLGDDTICDGLCHFGAVELSKQLQESENQVIKLKEYIKDKESFGDSCKYCRFNDDNNCYQNIFIEYLLENKKLEHKLKIAKEALQYYAEGKDVGDVKIEFTGKWAHIVNDDYSETAKIALQNIESKQNES